MAQPVTSRSQVRPGTRGTMRAHNLALALRCIAGGAGSVSRADISAATQLNKSTSSSLVDELIAGGLVREIGVTIRPAIGRPPTALALVADGPAGVGIEINVDSVTACVVDLTGAVRYQHVISEDQRGRSPEEVIGTASELAAAAAQAATAAGLVPFGAAVAVPGLVDPGGRIVLVPNLGWQDLDPAMLRGLGTTGGGEVAVDNEANFAALSEHDLLTGGASYLYLYGGIGVGAGVVLDGELYRGRHGWSGEIGHLTVEHDGPPCGCGGRGCLEQYAGQESVLRAAGLAGMPGPRRGLKPVGAYIRERAERGDPAMGSALERAGTALGLVIAGALNLLDVDYVVLGGVYRELADHLLPAVRREVALRYAGSRWASPTIVRATYGAEASALGAARSVVRRVVDDPSAWLRSRAALAGAR